jgi:hypothetical protein
MSEYVKTRRKVGQRKTRKSLVIGLALLVLFLAGGIAYFAFGNPSGSEESLERSIPKLPELPHDEEPVEDEGLVDSTTPPNLNPPEAQDKSPQSTTMADSELRRILNRHLNALGGMDRWTKIESIRLSGTIERDSQIVDIVILKKRPNKIRATVTLPLPGNEDDKLQVIRAHDGKTGWTATRLAGAQEMKGEELPPEAASELLGDAGIMPRLIKLWREGAALSLQEELELVDEHSHSCYVIHAEPKQGAINHVFYVSTKDHLLVRHESRHLNGRISITHPKAYQRKSGVMIPMLNLIDSETNGRSVMKTESVEIGVGIHGGYFGFSPEVVTAGAN